MEANSVADIYLCVVVISKQKNPPGFCFRACSLAGLPYAMCLQSALPRARRLRATAWADLPSRRSAWWQSDPLNPKPNATPQRTPRPPHAPTIESNPMCHSSLRMSHRKDGCPFAAMKSGNLDSRRNWRSCVKGIPYVVVLHPHRAKTVSPSMGPPSGITRLKSQ